MLRKKVRLVLTWLLQHPIVVLVLVLNWLLQHRLLFWLLLLKQLLANFEGVQQKAFAVFFSSSQSVSGNPRKLTTNIDDENFFCYWISFNLLH